MTDSRMMYRRLHGYIYILVLMQQFHLVMLRNVNHDNSNPEHLLVKLMTQKESLESTVDGYITDCSVDYLSKIEDVGHINTIPGMITRLMMALLYTVVGCEPATSELIQNLIHHVEIDTLNELIDAIYETAEDFEASVVANEDDVEESPSSTKNIAVNSAKSIKKLLVKLFNSVRSSKFGLYKSSVSNRLRKLLSALKKIFKKTGNGLADRAQRTINKLGDYKENATKSKLRLKRVAKACKKKSGCKGDANIEKPSAFVPTPPEEVSKGFKDMLKVARKNTNIKGLQNAHFGLSRTPLHLKGLMTMDKDSIHSKALSNVKEYPYDANYKRIEKNITDDKVPQSHTEQALLDDIDTTIKKRCGGQNCELYLWTKNSPCMKNTYKFKDNTVGNAKSCFAMLVELCHNHVKNTPGFLMCHIGFRDFYGLDNKGTDMRKEFMQELGSLTETMKNLAGKPNRYPTLTRKDLDNIGSFIKFYQIS